MSSHLCRSLRLVVITLCVSVAGWCTPAWAATWVVRPGQSIQAAIDHAQAGDVVEIGRAFYTEHVLIAKPLTLRGIQHPTISGANQGDTIRVTSPDVVIEGLIVRDSGDSLIDQNAGIYIWPGAHRAIVRHCELTYNLFGLWIEKANDVQIEGNVITGKVGRTLDEAAQSGDDFF